MTGPRTRMTVGQRARDQHEGVNHSRARRPELPLVRVLRSNHVAVRFRKAPLTNRRGVPDTEPCARGCPSNEAEQRMGRVIVRQVRASKALGKEAECVDREPSTCIRQRGLRRGPRLAVGIPDKAVLGMHTSQQLVLVEDRLGHRPSAEAGEHGQHPPHVDEAVEPLLVAGDQLACPTLDRAVAVNLDLDVPATLVPLVLQPTLGAQYELG